MNKLSMHVNGDSVEQLVAPRTHLGDFLRDSVHLTGTHLGCEHGVCGACTVLLDGAPVRSCITFAVACEGRQVTTIEGYDGDPVMQRLRPAFTRHHALQCGFCTPGMLATARDIVLRLPDADEARIRLELSGNLCRCTGYMGIVAAIRDVLAQLRDGADDAVESLRSAAREGRGAIPLAASSASAGRSVPAGFVPFEAIAPAGPAAVGAAGSPLASPAPPPGAADGAAVGSTTGTAAGVTGKGSRIDGAFDVAFAAEQVWAFMGDLPAVAGCLPGAEIESQDGDRVKGRVAIKFGPMAAAFVGAARLERNDATRSAVLRGAGQDALSRSRAQGDVSYRIESLSPSSTRVHVELLYSLQGPLAQFSRSGLVRDFVRRMIVDFGRNVGHRLAAPAADGADATAAAPLPVASINPVRAILGILFDRLRRAFGGRDRN